MDTKDELAALKDRHAVLRKCLDVSTDDVEPVARELVHNLLARSLAYVGPMPDGDRTDWWLKRRAFEHLVVEAVRHVLERN
jgi:hypothetical protein